MLKRAPPLIAKLTANRPICCRSGILPMKTTFHAGRASLTYVRPLIIVLLPSSPSMRRRCRHTSLAMEIIISEHAMKPHDGSPLAGITAILSRSLKMAPLANISMPPKQAITLNIVFTPVEMFTGASTCAC